MRVPLEVTFRDMEKSEALESYVQRYAERLEKLCGDRLDSCRVAIERPHRHSHHGSTYSVRVDVTMPHGHELAVRREAREQGPNDDVYKAVHDAFRAAEKRVKKVKEKQQAEVKNHPQQQLHAVVGKLFDDHGFLETTDGREIYFHAHSVLPPGFDALRVGSGVAYTEEAGAEGPQASSVRIVDRRGH